MNKNDGRIDQTPSQFFLCGIDEIKCNDKKIDILRRRVFQQQLVIRKLRQELAELKKQPRRDLEHLEFYAQNSTNKKFYSSSEWRKVRFDALVKSRVCVLCGSDSNLHVDHIIPRYLRPDLALDIKNLQILCRDCNLGKGTRKIKIRKKSQST